MVKCIFLQRIQFAVRTAYTAHGVQVYIYIDIPVSLMHFRKIPYGIFRFVLKLPQRDHHKVQCKQIIYLRSRLCAKTVNCRTQSTQEEVNVESREHQRPIHIQKVECTNSLAMHSLTKSLLRNYKLAIPYEMCWHH